MENTIVIEDPEILSRVFGKFDENINTLQMKYSVAILGRGGDVMITGEEGNVRNCTAAINAMCKVARDREVGDKEMENIFHAVEENSLEEMLKATADGVCVTSTGKVVRAKTPGQRKYIEAISQNTIVMGVGPAGTGKTYLAVAMAVKAFRAHEISRIILTRPAVEAGEKLGFLPGDMQNKVDPYLRPLYDALFDMMGAETFSRNMEKGSIEVAPLAYMRGRTLDDAFIILDEAQNTTREQFKMFLTRLGMGSKMVITGDITQIDLPETKRSGLVDAMHILKGIEDIAINRFTERDVVRHKLVTEIIKAYEKNSGRSV